MQKKDWSQLKASFVISLIILALFSAVQALLVFQNMISSNTSGSTSINAIMELQNILVDVLLPWWINFRTILIVIGLTGLIYSAFKFKIIKLSR